MVRTKAMGLPYYGVGAMIALLKDFFLDPENSGGEYVTAPPGADGGSDPGRYLQVADRFEWGENIANPKPRLVVSFSGAARQPVGLGMGFEKHNWSTGRTTRRSLVTSRYDVMVYSRSIMTSERIAGTVLTAIHAYAPKIREVLDMVKIDSTNINPAIPVFPGGQQSRLELVMSAVTINMIQSMVFTIEPTPVKLSGVGIIVEDDQSKSVINRIGTGPTGPLV